LLVTYVTVTFFVCVTVESRGSTVALETISELVFHHPDLTTPQAKPPQTDPICRALNPTHSERASG
jgi:hypothetical protein